MRLHPPREDLPVHAQQQSAAAVSPYAVTGDVENQRLNSSRGSAADNAEKVALPETQSLWYMAQSKEHRHLLKHPVVTSFLHMKWGRIRRHFNFNLRYVGGWSVRFCPRNGAYFAQQFRPWQHAVKRQTCSPGSTFSSCSS